MGTINSMIFDGRARHAPKKAFYKEIEMRKATFKKETGMRHTVLLLAAGLGLACWAGAADAAAIIGPETFESGATYNWSNAGGGDPNVIVSQLGSSTTPPDPFGPSGNHSLMIEDMSTSSNARVSWWNHSASATGKGTLSADLYSSGTGVSSPSGTPYMVIYAGNNPNMSSVPSSNSFMPTAAQAFYLYTSNTSLYVSDGSSAPQLDNTWTVGMPYQVTLNFDYAAKTFSGTLTDLDVPNSTAPLKKGTQTTFAFASGYNAVTYTSIDAIDIIAGFSTNNNSRVVVDNLTLAVPEPTTAALLGLGGLGLLMRRRRTAAC
jgi:hypothetical protein